MLSFLKTLNLPTTTTNLAWYCFYGDVYLEKLIVSSNFTSITGTNNLYACYPLNTIDLAKVTEISSNDFTHCETIKKINLKNCTTIGGTNNFQKCDLLEEFILQNATKITNYMLSQCYCISKITMPNVTSVGANAFNGSTSLKYIYFTNNTTVPTLGGTNAFTGLTNYYIVVPDSLYDTWITTNNWSNSGVVSHIVKASAV